MAKNKDIDLDKLDFDSWDDSDLNFDFNPGKDDRTPVKKLSSGFFSGLKSSVTSPSFIKKNILRTLPPGYTEASELVDDIRYNVSDLYNTAAKELEPATRAAAKATKKMLPKIKSKLPKKLADRLENALENLTYENKSFGVNQDEANMGLELGEIFKVQAEQQAQIAKENAVDNRLSTVLNLRKHKEQIGELSVIRSGIERLVGYQDNVNFKFQRKSLELQYKQYYVARDALELSKAASKATTQALADIVKNTSLPEAVKIKKSELGSMMLKEKSLRMMGSGVRDFAGNYVKNFSDNIKRRVKTDLSPYAGMAGMAGGMDDEMFDMMPGGKVGAAGELGGSLLADFLGNEAADRFRGKVNNNKFIRKYGAKASSTVNNLPSMANEWALSRTKGTGPAAGLQRLFKSLAPKYNLETKLTNDGLGSINEPAHFDNQTRKSIVEVIPGFLARILQSLEIQRTGDPSTDLVMYDVNTNRFSSKGAVTKSVMKRMFSSTNINRTNNDTQYVLDVLDKGNKLSPEAKKILQSQILADVANNRTISPERYIDENNYGSFVKAGQKKELIKFFKSNYKFDADNKLLNDVDNAEMMDELSSRAGMLRSSIPDSRVGAQRYVDAGYGGLLEDAGIINKSGFNDNLDFNKVLEIYRNGGIGDTDPVTGTPASKARKKKKRSSTAVTGGYSGLSTTMNYGSSTFTDNSNTTPSSSAAASPSVIDTLREMLEASYRLDEQRNIKLDEMLLRLDGLGPDGKNIGPGTIVFRNRVKGIMGNMKGAAKSMYSKVRGLTAKAFMLPINIAGGVGSGIIKTGKGAARLLSSKAQDIYSRTNNSIPLLRAELMKAGEYTDATTGKVIRSYKDIKGNVKDRAGNIVLTINDIKDGLVDSRGRRIKSALFSGIKSLLSGAGDLAGGAIGLYGKLLALPFKLVAKVVNGYAAIKDAYVNGEASPRILANRLKAGEYINARTGKVIKKMKELKDGVKDIQGNWVLTPSEAGNLTSSDGSVLKGIVTAPFKIVGAVLGAGARMIGGGVRKLKGMFGKKKGYSADEQQVGVLIEIRDILDSRLPSSNKMRAGSASDLLARRKGRGAYVDPRIGKKKGTGKDEDGDQKGMVAGLISAVGGLAAAVASSKFLSSAKGAVQGLWSFGKKALTSNAAKVAGRFALNAGRFLLTTGLRTAGTALASAMGLITLPVVLTVAAVAAVAVGGYYLYKYLKNKDAYLTRLRLAQYGVDPSDGSDAKAVGKLETLLVKNIQMGATPTLDVNQELFAKCLEIFDIDEDDGKEVNNFAMWFQKRFKPVFLSHAAAANKLAPGTNCLEADDKIPLTSKLEFIKIVTFGTGSDSPYNVSNNPNDMDEPLPVGESFVKKYLDAAIEWVNSKLKDTKPDASTAAKGSAVVAAVAPIPKGNGNVTSNVKSLMLAGATGGVAGLIGKAITITATAGFAMLSSNSKPLDPLTAVRLKVYGLVDFTNSDKVNNLLAVEEAMVTKTTYDGKGVASFTGSIESLMSLIGPRFGVDFKNDKDVASFGTWLMSRFIPAYLNYCTAIRNLGKNIPIADAEKYLKPAQKLAVARSLAGSYAGDGASKISIWSIKDSPYAGVMSNDNAGSIEPHIKYLESAMKEDEIKASEKVLSNKETSAVKSVGFLDSAKSAISNFAGGVYDKAKGLYDNAVDSTSRGMENVAGAYSSVKDRLQTFGGNVADAVGNIIHPGTGTGGDINSIPIPNGPDGKFETYKGVIARAAEIVGIDPTLMATMANIESGFKGMVKASTSSATGLYQFIKGTWNDMMAKYGSQYGIAPNTKPTDPRANALMGALFVRDNLAALKNIGRPLTDTDAYAAHFLGVGGAKKLLSADPNAIAADLMPDAARANNPIFYSGNRARTVGEVYAHLGGLVKNKRVVLSGATSIPANDPSFVPPANNAPSSAGLPGVKPVMASAPAPMNIDMGLSSQTSPAATAPTQNVVAQQSSQQDKTNAQTNLSSDYQAVAFNEQRKASDNFLNGTMDGVQGILSESLTVQKSMDVSLLTLVKLLQDGSLTIPTQQERGANLQNVDASKTGANSSGKTVRGPVNVSRNTA